MKVKTVYESYTGLMGSLKRGFEVVPVVVVVDVGSAAGEVADLTEVCLTLF